MNQCNCITFDISAKGKQMALRLFYCGQNQKEFPVYQGCHQDVRRGRYDGASLSDLANPGV